MLNTGQIDQIAVDVGRAFMPAGALLEAHSQPFKDEAGEEQLRVTLVVREKSLDEVDGAIALNTLSELQDRLQSQGETRFAIVYYMSDKEFAADGGA